MKQTPEAIEYQLKQRIYYQHKINKRKYLQHWYTLTIAHLFEIWTGNCAACEEPITLNCTKDNHDMRAILDRRKEDRGYEIGYVAWLCPLCHNFKTNRSLEQLNKLIWYWSAS